MARFKENELAEKLKDFANESKIEIRMEGNLDGTLILEGVTIVYNDRNGFININSNSGKLKINTTLVYKYEKTAENDIHIFGDSEIIKIRKL